MKIYLGVDHREKLAYDVAVRSLARHCDIEPTPLDHERLHASGLLRRPMDRRGQLYDLYSNAPCSTDFAISRFLTPLLAQTGYALFCDSDVVFLDDPRKMLFEADATKAVQVVHHQVQQKSGMKMDGQAQVLYPRKNQSSVCLYNCDHPANRRLTLDDINHRPGRDLHNFYWLSDAEIGELNPRWNWLVGVKEKPEDIGIAHYTLGIPTLSDNCEHADIWWKAGK